MANFHKPGLSHHTTLGGTGISIDRTDQGSLLIGDGEGFKLNTLIGGTGITIVNGDGTITISGATAYSLPIASASVLGGIKVGDNLTIDGGGVLSAILDTDLGETISTSSTGGLQVLNSQANIGRGFVLGVEPVGWHSLGFDDSGWDSIAAQTGPVFSALIPGTTWVTDSTIQGAQPAFKTWLYRRTFNLGSSVVTSATLQIFADNQVLDCWLNGVHIFSGLDYTADPTTPPVAFSVPTSLFVLGGANDLAVKVFNDVTASTTSLDYQLRINQAAISSGNVGPRPNINFIPGPNILIDVVDDSITNSVDVTISSADFVLPLAIAKNGTLIGTRPKLNFIPGSNVTLTVADNSGTNSVDVTVASTGGGGGGGTVTSVAMTVPSGFSVTGSPITGSGTLAITLSGLAAGIITSGILPVARGGTGLDSSSAANGKLLIGNGSGFSLNTITAGANIGITNTAGNITIDFTGGAGGGGALSPLTTKGDIWVYSTVDTRLGVDSLPDGYVLSKDSTTATGLAWALPAGPVDGKNMVEHPNASPSIYDDEFNDSAGMSGPVNGLAAKWSKHNLGTSTWLKLDDTLAPGCLAFQIPSGQTMDQSIYQNTPAGDFTIEALIDPADIKTRQMWFIFILDTGGNGIGVGWDNANPNLALRAMTAWQQTGSTGDFSLTSQDNRPVQIWLKKVGNIYTGAASFSHRLRKMPTQHQFVTGTQTFVPAYIGFGRIYDEGGSSTFLLESFRVT